MEIQPKFLKDFCEYLGQLNMILTLELEPMIFYMINSTDRIIKMIEDVNMPNIFANIDIGHLAITREPPHKLNKLKNYIMHAHISDCDGMQHANLVIGTWCNSNKRLLNKINKYGFR